MTLPSFFTELSNTMNYGGGEGLITFSHRISIRNGFRWRHCVSQNEPTLMLWIRQKRRMVSVYFINETALWWLELR